MAKDRSGPKYRPYLGKVQISGQTSGWVKAGIFKNNRMDLQAGADMEGVLRTDRTAGGIDPGGAAFSLGRIGNAFVLEPGNEGRGPGSG